MSISVKANQTEPCPQGLHAAVCCDVIDLGIVATNWGDKPQVQLRWQVDMLNRYGKRYELRKTYTASLGQKANLRKDLEMWRGKAFTAKELQGFDLERLLGVNCQLNIVHHLADSGSTYANVSAIVPAARNSQTLVVVDYQRQQDRPATGPDGKPVAAGDPFGGTGPVQAASEANEDGEPPDWAGAPETEAPDEDPIPF